MHIFTSRNFFLVWAVIFIEIIYLTSALFAFSDNLLGVCSWSMGVWGSISVHCPPILSWYETFVSINRSMRVFLIAPPLLFLYAFSLRLLNKLEKTSVSAPIVSENIKNNSDLRKIKIIKIFLYAFIPIFIMTIYAFGWRASVFNQQKVDIKKTELEEKYIAVSGGDPDFCPDAPDDIYLLRTNAIQNPKLVFPVGYWTGLGVAYLSRENYWDGITADPKREFHLETYFPGVVDFSTEDHLFFRLDRANIGDLGKGKRYDLRIFIVKDKTLSGLDKKSFLDKFTFFRGVFKERFVQGGIEFDVNSPDRITKEPCLTVTIKN